MKYFRLADALGSVVFIFAQIIMAIMGTNNLKVTARNSDTNKSAKPFGYPFAK